jgi:hypothetical protein
MILESIGCHACDLQMDNWIIPNHLGASVAGDHMKRRIPVVYGVLQSMGALGPGDSDANKFFA